MSLYESMALPKALKGKRLATGQNTPEGGDYGVDTGMAVVEYCGVSLAVAPTIDHTYSFAIPSVANEGHINIKSYKPTDNGDPTPTACGNGEPVLVSWWAIGT
jgi:hypothetical protein